MQAGILSIGDELILGQAADTNPLWLADRLASRAVTTVERRAVPDDRRAIARAIRELAGCCDVLVITGGLGPTPDDLTRVALGDVLTPGRPLTTDPAGIDHLREWFERRRRQMPESNLAQAQRPQGSRLIPNPRGTAMGIAGSLDDCLIFALPGPPHEMQVMFDEHVLPALPGAEGQQVLRTACVHAFGLAEAAAAQRLEALLGRDRSPRVGITVSESIVTARLQAGGKPEQADRCLAETGAVIMRRWHPYAFGRDAESLPSVVGTLLAEAGQTLITAESCTGGLLGKMVVDVSGSSTYYAGGWVTYSDALKTTCLGVPKRTLDEHGAVSEAIASAMARGALAESGAAWSLAVTGVAGPGGGSPEKPPGTVYIGLGRKQEEQVAISVRRFAFTGNRSEVRDRAAKSALQLLRFALIDVPAGTALLWEYPASSHR
ncbi:MAG: CinA family nicotinamide mononucleotide deamidase-related protein [Planctomycetota bacterium]|jgi:nicotinamide-nucleotide amidase